MGYKKGQNAGWREIDGSLYYFRSTWESRYAHYLEWLRLQGTIQEWLYEPKMFEFTEKHVITPEGKCVTLPTIKHGTTRYMPDFQVVEKDGTSSWVEVKGHMDAASKTKIARFRKYYPSHKLTVVDAKWFSRNNRQLKNLIPGWE